MFIHKIINLAKTEIYAIADGKNWQFAQKPSFDLLFYLNSSRGFPETNSKSFWPNISKLASLNSKQMLFCMFFFDLNTQIPANSADYISKWISLLKKRINTRSGMWTHWTTSPSHGYTRSWLVYSASFCSPKERNLINEKKTNHTGISQKSHSVQSHNYYADNVNTQYLFA